jgi:hypothetical protein
MSADVFTGINIKALADACGLSPGQIVGPDAEQFRIDLANPVDARTKVAAAFERIDSRRGNVRMDDTRRHDAATAFTTNALTTVLAPIIISPSTRFLFTPNMTNGAPLLLPVQNKVALGMQELEVPVLTLTGEARRTAAGGLKNLRNVGLAEDRKKQPVGLYGVRFEWDTFELMQAAHLGRSPQAEKQRAASFAMAEYFEDFASYGDVSTKRPGFLNHGACFTIELGTNMGTLSSADTMLNQLAYIHQSWKTANPNRIVTGVVMPEAHYMNMVLQFKGASGEGAHAWTFAKTIFPWLNNVITDDRMLAASQDGFSMWQLWSADGESQYLEASPNMLLGPFPDEVVTSFYMIGQIGGLVNANPRTIMRVNFLS